MGFDDISYFVKMHENDSLSQLLNAYEEETRILSDIMGYDEYDDKWRQLRVQRDHIDAIKMLIGKNGGR